MTVNILTTHVSSLESWVVTFVVWVATMSSARVMWVARILLVITFLKFYHQNVRLFCKLPILHSHMILWSVTFLCAKKSNCGYGIKQKQTKTKEIRYVGRNWHYFHSNWIAKCLFGVIHQTKTHLKNIWANHQDTYQPSLKMTSASKSQSIKVMQTMYLNPLSMILPLQKDLYGHFPSLNSSNCCQI